MLHTITKRLEICIDINKLTVSYEYSRINREDLPLPIQREFTATSLKNQTLSVFFFLLFWNLN